MNETVSPADFNRLETKLDKVAEAVSKLVLVEERQSNQTVRIDKHDAALETMQLTITRLHARLDKYAYLASGAAFVAMSLFEVARFIFK